MDATIDPKLVEPTILHSVDPRQTSLKHELVIIHTSASISPGMSRQKVPITFTYQKKGTTPPIFVAGSFSDPPWHPQEMDVSIDQRGCHRFTKQVLVDDGSEIQYKFRIGLGNWWALDDNADTVLDNCGNTNNILRVSINRPREVDTKAPNPRINEIKGSSTNSGTRTPDFARTAAEVSDSARIIDPETPEAEMSDGEAGGLGTRRLSNTPISQVAETAMEVATIAATLDVDSSDLDEETDDEDCSCPVFSHEFMGPADHNKETSGDDGDHARATRGRLGSKTAMDFGESAIEFDDVDFDNPNLEAFPSNNRESILAAVRRISTSIDADRSVVPGLSPSPIIPIFRNYRAVNSLENSGVTPSSLDTPPEEKRNLRPNNAVRRSGSARGNARAASTSSLRSIVEDDEHHNGKSTEAEKLKNPFIQHPGPSWGSPEPAIIDDENDEGIAMNNEFRRRARDPEDPTPLVDLQPTTSNNNDANILDPGLNKSSPVPDGDVDASAEDEDHPLPTQNKPLEDNPTISTRRLPGSYESDSTSNKEDSTWEAKSTSVDIGNQADVRKRTADRPVTPPSTNYFQDSHKPADWIDVCLRVVFVKWIGGLASWLYRRRHRA
ncbi:uncharacterized protein F4822DRAFT_367715 [Hypoxylon trugodes]|uniref:uncharacterized protein n=1 Tax=Hypoxylon trugodes TaxID=326681 RepID=UPI0021902275|nr:uncharacterized protein F4822DRAFT_367715 [Hypoxylon trugodes]KAI1384597.1 hypothetical protein F4822DRAFT_367715 [Hypoxylon trugodes]